MPSIPETWLDEFIVSLPSAGYSHDPDIIQLANGNILVGWTTNVDTGAGNALGLDMVGQIFDLLGNRVGDEISLNQAYFIDNEVDVDMAALADGGFLVVYSDADPSGTSIRLERHAADGSIITNATIGKDNTTTAPNYQNAHAGNDVIDATSTIDADIHDGGTGIDTIDWSGAILGNGTRFNLDMGTGARPDHLRDRHRAVVL